MPVDASIFARYLGAPKSVDQYSAEADNAESGRLQLMLQRGQLGDQQRARSEQDRLMRLMQGLPATASDDDRINALRGGGFLGQADAVQKSALERQKTQADIGKVTADTEKSRVDADKDRIANSLRMFEVVGQLMGGVTDQATYDRARAQAEQAFPDLAGKMPPQYDPARIAQGQAQAMSVKDRLEQEWKAKGYSLDVRKADEAERDNRARVGASYANAAAIRDTAQATRDAAGMRRDQDTEMKLADDYRAQSKDFKEATSAYKQITATLDSATKSPAATLAAATKFMKILDPGSVVRESELGMALAASGVIDRAMNYVNILQRGKVLTPTQAADFKTISGDMYKAAQQVQQTIDADYKAKAEAYNLRPEMVTQDLGQNSQVINFADLK